MYDEVLGLSAAADLFDLCSYVSKEPWTYEKRDVYIYMCVPKETYQFKFDDEVLGVSAAADSAHTIGIYLLSVCSRFLQQSLCTHNTNYNQSIWGGYD